MTATVSDLRFDHLLHLTDRRGTFEHACFAEPRPEHGYCTDDMARVLVVASREPNSDGAVNGLTRVAVQFLNDAQSYAGACRNRMDTRGGWGDEPALEDCWGRCIWALGTAAAHSDVSLVRRLAVIQFERAAKVRSPWPRAMAFAALGAAELLSFDPAQKRIFGSCGEGAIAVIRQVDADRYESIGTIATVKRARTSIFNPETGHLYLAVPRIAERPDQENPEIWVYQARL